MSDLDKDPVVHSSLSKPLFISSVILVVCLGWALYDEVYGTRPWRGYQARFRAAYTRFIRQAKPGQVALEKQIRASGDFQRLDKQMTAAEQAVAAKVAQLDREVSQVLVPQILALNEPFQEVRSHVSAITYQIEVTSGEGRKNSLRNDIAELKKEVHSVKLPNPDGSTRSVKYTYDQMERELNGWKDRKAQLLQQRVDVLKPATELRAQRDKYLSDRLPDVSSDTIGGLERKMDTFGTEIRQIHIKDIDLVDRCESCHLATREPVTLTKAAMGGEAAF